MLAGVDGIKNGWVAAILREDGSTEVHTFPSFRSLIEDTTLASIVIDIPIGLPDYGARACDLEARRCIGQSRRSSVFPAPIRSMLTAHDWKDACCIRWDREGKKCSKQVAAILPKIREVDSAMTRDLQKRIREGHPEVSFFMINRERPMTSKKKTTRGKSERLALLVPCFPDIEKNLQVKPRALWVDILDAYACLWTAKRIAENQSKSFPQDNVQDGVGLIMEIVA